MKIIMRLYRQHDLDLIYLHALKEFSLQQSIKNALRAYINDTAYAINAATSMQSNITLPKQVQFHILLDEVEDADIIKWVLGISRGYRNSAIKNLTRCYLCRPSLTPYYDTSNLSFKQEFTKGMRESLKNNDTQLKNNNKSVADEVLSDTTQSTSAQHSKNAGHVASDKQQNAHQSGTEDWFDAFESIIN